MSTTTEQIGRNGWIKLDARCPCGKSLRWYGTVSEARGLYRFWWLAHKACGLAFKDF